MADRASPVLLPPHAEVPGPCLLVRLRAPQRLAVGQDGGATHNLIGFAYVVHTHPTLVNALMCSQDARKEVEFRFGTEVLFMEYSDPGYVLFKKLQELLEEFKNRTGKSPKIIFLQNHGI